jgi:cytochrome P450
MQIYGGHGEARLPRDNFFPAETPGLRCGLPIPNNKQHPRMRKQLANAFSQRALDEQVPLIQSNIDALVAQFQTLANSGEPLNIADWLNFTSLRSSVISLPVRTFAPRRGTVPSIRRFRPRNIQRRALRPGLQQIWSPENHRTPYA